MSEERIHRRTKASLTIRGDHVDPEAWALYFGLAPASFSRKDEHSITPSGRPSYWPSPTGRVSFKCRGPDVWAIDAHVNALRAMLDFPRPDFLARLAREGSKTELWIYVENDDGTNPPIYGQVTENFIREIDARFELDVYDENTTF
jgi:hypothetical protein